MQREIITTADGSKTIQIKEWNEQYHSIHGAVQEAYHVFIRSGLDLFKGANTSILEIGFGTGLNAFITLLETAKSKTQIRYVGVEKYPVAFEEALALDYASTLGALEKQDIYEALHASVWEKPVTISDTFELTKQKMDFKDIEYQEMFNLIYYDAFGARVQPELWTEAIFRTMHEALKPDGILVTYAAKGSVRRAMQAVGFLVERLPGPPGKREMLRAKKL